MATSTIHLANGYFDTGYYGVRLNAIDNGSTGHNLNIQTRTTATAAFVNSFTVISSGNVGIGITNPSNILQVGLGGRLRIANNISDYTLIGTNDTDGNTNTRIVLSGNTRTSYVGNIDYIATTATGNHTFYTNGSTTLMTLTPSMLNITTTYGLVCSQPLATTLAISDSNWAGNGYTLNAINTGDVNIYSYWGTSINLGAGGANPSVAGQTRIPNTIAFTVNTKSGNTYSNLFTILQSGNVGIGKTNPGSLLDINGTLNVTGVTKLQAGTSSAPAINFGTSGIGIYGISSTSVGIAGDLTISGAINNNTINLTGVNPCLSIGVSGNGSLGYASVNGGFSGSADIGDLVLRSDAGKNLILQANGGGSAGIYINSANNVGIGTTTLVSGAKLNVNGIINISNTASVGNPGIGTYGTGSDGTKLVLYQGDSGAHPFAFGIANDTLWYSVPGTGAHKWFVGGTSCMTLSSTSLNVNGNIISSLQGSISNNSYTWNNNTNTGLYQPAANNIGFSAAANNIMNISPSNITINSNLIFTNDPIFQGGPIQSLIGGIDDKIILANATTFNNQPDYPYSIGYSSSNLWTSIPSYSSNTFYVGGTNVMNISKNLVSINGNVGIGKTNPSSTFHINQSAYVANTPCLVLNCGGANGTLPRGIGSPMIQLGDIGYSSTAGDYYGIGFGYNQSIGTSGYYTCCEIGTLITNKTVGEIGDIVLSTRSTNVSTTVASERMRIKSSGNVGIGTTNPNANLELYSSTQLQPRLILSGQEFYTGGYTSTDGIAFLCGVNRTGNRQLWIGDSANLTQNATNSLFRIANRYGTTGYYIDCVSTDGTTLLPLIVGANTAISISGSGATTINNPLNITGVTTFQLGSSSAPAINFGTSGIGIYGISSTGVGITGNVGIGTNNPSNILQVGTGNRLRIANNISDYTLIGTNDTDGNANTRIVISGNTRSGNVGDIEYLATSTGSHVFYSNGSSKSMTINSSGLVGIGTTNPGTLLHVNGSITGLDGITIKGTNPNITLLPSGQTTGGGLGNASTGGAFSTWAAINDTILRSNTSQALILQSGTGGAAIYINSTNNVGIGTNNPGTKLVVNGPIYTQSSTTAAPASGTYGSGTDGTRIVLYPGSSGVYPSAIGIGLNTLWYSVPSGSIHNWYCGGISFMNLSSSGLLSVYDDIVGFSAYSDRRLKENIKPLEINCIDLINKINPVEFTWRNTEKVVERKREKKDYGFIAQEIEELLPTLVQEVDEYKTIKYEKLVPYLVKAFQEQSRIIDELQSRIIALENK